MNNSLGICNEMDGQVIRRLEGALTGAAKGGEDAVLIAGTIAAICRNLSEALAPVIGRRGVAALYGRSFHVAADSHPWLRSGLPNDLAPLDVTALRARLEVQRGVDAAAGGATLLQAFHELLASLVGPAFAERLLGPVWPGFASAPAEGRLGSSQSPQLLEANEQLILSALDAREQLGAAQATNRRQIETMTMVVHELRNPIMPIRLAAARLGRMGSDDPAVARAAAIIDRQIHQMVHLIDDLLDVARVNTGKLRVSRQVIDMADIVDAAVEACRPAMDVRLQTLDVRVPGRPLELNAGPVRLTQVLSNLLDNACKYTPQRGRITLQVAAADGAIVVTVTDSGIGISAATLPRIFDPFVQESPTSGSGMVGLGVGLTVVQEIVKAHGGTVVASSAGRDQGTCFVVTLPAAAVAQKAASSSSTCRTVS